MKKVKFINSPLGLGLAYSQGEEAEFNENQANELVELGLAEFIEADDIEKAIKVEPKEIKKAVKK